MRRIAKHTISILLAVNAIGLSTAYAVDNISVVLNGEKVTFTDVQPIVYNERTLIPIRAVFEQLGCYVDWDSANQMAVIGNENNIIFVPINEAAMRFYDISKDVEQDIELDVPATIIEGRTMIPLRAVCEAIGADVKWEENTRTIYIDN